MRNRLQPNESAFLAPHSQLLIPQSRILYCLLTIAHCLAPTAYCAADNFENSIKPILRDSCITCHSIEKVEGELDLQRFRSASIVKQHTEICGQVRYQLELGEMPPKDAKQLSSEQKKQLISWVRKTLDEAALANAGEPGPVVLRRLSNQEYTYTLRDLTGIETLDPAQEFPVDGAAGAGFINVGAALVMSPTPLTKYLDISMRPKKSCGIWYYSAMVSAFPRVRPRRIGPTKHTNASEPSTHDTPPAMLWKPSLKVSSSTRVSVAVACHSRTISMHCREAVATVI